MIAIIDYNVGNLFSVKNALDFIGERSVITCDAAELERADAMILPGVGAFPDAMAELEKTGLVSTIKAQAQAQKKPLLGICLGMQMLFDEGYEFRVRPGLGLIRGKVDKIPAAGLKIPHMGWNKLEFQNFSPLLKGVPQGSYAYFVHSFMAFAADEAIAAYTQYGVKVPALVQSGNVYGAQFHPEKSGEAGLTILRNFGNLVK
jgi:imidazole glycerol-phosphate synthase subunit HisH